MSNNEVSTLKEMKHEGLECVNNIWHIQVYEIMMIFYYAMIHIKFPIFVKSLLVLKTICKEEEKIKMLQTTWNDQKKNKILKLKAKFN
jgi:hypothetical protein